MTAAPGVSQDARNLKVVGSLPKVGKTQPPNDGHRQNILTTSGTIVGIAILIDQQHGQLWLTEDFAHV